VRSGAARQPGEVVPAADAKRAVPPARCVAEEVALGGRPHVVREVHRERLGDIAPQLGRGIEVAVRRMLHRRPRQAEALADRRRASGSLVRRRPVRATRVPRLALHGPPYLIGALEHRRHPTALARIAGVEREP
jgi:hypothetical protein